MEIELIYIENQLDFECGSRVEGVWESQLLNTKMEKVTQVEAMTADKETLRSFLYHRQWWTVTKYCTSIQVLDFGTV